ncbi:AFR215Wp [Eremothecium gossypii ATCC 10895]|uniref:AFR215Wp n=1 Tax=Eremothecium gossypii (strain ATCC 10895 / CBS 109.51 / FGSC 9923 / NRRL Y-1056) TaxID=284811 RepID=Q753V7_EREGS|nr:AFR215Wp [Eremothecium gossypii ATCC 10895]AAS53586.1 AFR215Wp [Eremothecium gossypii ATCC 10895]AEY97899.1 FAFR215Wp [Eremothecium gossypii FDAG1]
MAQIVSVSLVPQAAVSPAPSNNSTTVTSASAKSSGSSSSASSASSSGAAAIGAVANPVSWKYGAALGVAMIGSFALGAL